MIQCNYRKRRDMLFMLLFFITNITACDYTFENKTDQKVIIGAVFTLHDYITETLEPDAIQKIQCPEEIDFLSLRSADGHIVLKRMGILAKNSKVTIEPYIGDLKKPFFARYNDESRFISMNAVEPMAYAEELTNEPF